MTIFSYIFISSYIKTQTHTYKKRKHRSLMGTSVKQKSHVNIVLQHPIPQIQYLSRWISFYTIKINWIDENTVIYSVKRKVNDTQNGLL